MFQEIIFDQEFVFGDLNMFWAQLSPILVWSIRQVLKWVLRIKGPKDIYAQEK